MNSCTNYNLGCHGEVTWSAPSNIALVKYWGKFGNQLPCNPSLSFTLDMARTKTTLCWRPKKGEESQIDFLFHGKPEEKFAHKIKNYIKKNAGQLPFLKEFDLKIFSENTFPHSAGIASSASSMASLALGLVSMEQKVLGKDHNEEDFNKRASYLARLGSGSACRSIAAPMVLWGSLDSIADSCNEYGIEISDLDPVFLDFRDAILIVDSKEKSVSSSQGHALMENHPYAQTRFKEARQNCLSLLSSLKTGDLDTFGEIVEREALELHGLMASSRPSFILMKPKTLAVIEKVREFRKSTGHPLYFTLDAGPNVHLLYPSFCAKDIEDFIRGELAPLLENGKWLADNVGKGARIE